MKNLLSLLLPFALAVTAFAGPSPDDKAIQGTWLPTKAVLGGHPLGTNFNATTTLTLTDGKYVVIADANPDKGTYTLDAAAKLKTLDITGVEGPNTGKKIPCIYELNGNTLKICYNLGGADRPTEFKSAPGTKFFLVTYTRKKM